MKETARTLCFQAVIITNKNTHINTTPLQKPLLNNHDDCVCCLLDIITSNLVAIPLQGKNSKRTVASAWRSSFPRHQAIDAVRNAIFTSHVIIAKSHKIPELAFD